MNEHVTFSSLEVPAPLGRAEFQPTLEGARKLGYAVDDESGWLIGDPQDELIHPVILSMYLWWPQGFYQQAPAALGHFDMFKAQYGHLFEFPYLHGKPHAKFYRPFKAGTRVIADVSLSEKYERRQREFVVILARFADEAGNPVADYRHTVMIRSHAPMRGIASKEPA